MRTLQYPNDREHHPRSCLLLRKKVKKGHCQNAFLGIYSSNPTKRSDFTLWRDVGKGNLHEALQGQKSHTGVDDKPQELTCFTYRERGHSKNLTYPYFCKLIPFR